MPLFRVVVADDCGDVRFVLRKMLELSGSFEVVGEAADGEQALHLSLEHHPAALVTDLRMPELDGLEVIRHLRAVDPQIALVLITSDRLGREVLEELESLRAASLNKLQVGKLPPLLDRLCRASRISKSELQPVAGQAGRRIEAALGALAGQP